VVKCPVKLEPIIKEIEKETGIKPEIFTRDFEDPNPPKEKEG
jgi:hypothetical protein